MLHRHKAMNSTICDLLTAKAQIHSHCLGICSSASAAVAQGLAVVGQPAASVVASPARALLDQIGEGRQRHELAAGEEVAPLSRKP